MGEYCDFTECREPATIIVGKEGKHVCFFHATIYQIDLSDRIKRTGWKYFEK